MALLLVVGLVVALPLIAGSLLVAGLARRPGPAPSQAAEAARRHSAGVNALGLACLAGGLVGGVAAVTGLASGLDQGRYLGLVPAAAGLAFEAVQAVGELTWPRPIGTLRRAPLTRRTVDDVAPRWLRRVTWSWGVLIALTVAGCGLTADGGRTITRTFAAGAASAGPFPGWYYGGPILGAVGLVLLTAEGVLRLVAHRPAVMDAAPEWDLGLRRVSAHRLLRWTQLALGWTASGVLVVASRAVHSAGSDVAVDGVPAGSTAYAVVSIAMLLLGGAVWIASVVATVVPARPPAQDRAPAPISGPVPA